MKAASITLLAVTALLALTACSKPASEERFADEKVNVDMVAPPPPAANATPAANPAFDIPQLAYDYQYGFTANAKGIMELISTDQTSCENAGLVACQMVSLTADNAPDANYVRKKLELRVSPEWLKTWQGALASRLTQSGGKIISQTITSEDLSLQIVDMDAHIKNKMALRDRLQQIIRTSTGKIADLVEAETQLSEVQQDIDSSQSSLAVMQKRVATIHLILTYQSRTVAASHGTFSPVSEALKSVLGNAMTVIGVLITLLSFLVPLALVSTPLVWLFIKWQRNRKPKPNE